MLEPDAHGLFQPRPGIQNNQAVRRRAEHSPQRGGRALESAGEGPGAGGVGHRPGQPEMEAVRGRDRSGVAEIRNRARDRGPPLRNMAPTDK